MPTPTATNASAWLSLHVWGRGSIWRATTTPRDPSGSSRSMPGPWQLGQLPCRALKRPCMRGLHPCTLDLPPCTLAPLPCMPVRSYLLSPEPCTAWDTVYVGSMHVHARLIVSSSSSTCRTGPDGTCTYTSPSTPGTLSVLTGKLAMQIGFCLASRPLTLHVQDVPCRYGRLQDACIKGLQGCM